jgi:hypothetical protein
MKNIAIAILGTALIFVLAAAYYTSRQQFQANLDTQAAQLVRSSCLYWDYQYEHPQPQQPCQASGNAICISANLWDATPTIQFSGDNSENLGTINCLDYQSQ